MSLLLLEIWLYLLFAGLIGGLIGWWIRGNCQEKLHLFRKELREEYDKDVAKLEVKRVLIEKNFEDKLKHSEDAWSLKYASKSETDVSKAQKKELLQAQTEVKILKKTLQNLDKNGHLENQDTKSTQTESDVSILTEQVQVLHKEKLALKSDLHSSKLEVKVAQQALKQVDKRLFNDIGDTQSRYALAEIGGIGAQTRKKLQELDIHTSEDLIGHLLEDKKSQKKIAQKIGIETRVLEDWAGKSDLMRLPGLGDRAASMLQKVGIFSQKYLRNNQAEELHTKLQTYHDGADIPSVLLLERWISYAHEDAFAGKKSVPKVDQSGADIEKIRGVSKSIAKKFRKSGIKSTQDLARCYFTENLDTKKLAKKLGIEVEELRAWASIADLMSIEDVPADHAEVMQMAGVSSREVLKSLDLQHLHQKIGILEDKMPTFYTPPSLESLTLWKERA